MDSNARKQLNKIREALRRQKHNSRDKSLVDGDLLATSELKPGERSGVYVTKETLLNLINNMNEREFKISEGSQPYGFSVSLPRVN